MSAVDVAAVAVFFLYPLPSSSVFSPLFRLLLFLFHLFSMLRRFFPPFNFFSSSLSAFISVSSPPVRLSSSLLLHLLLLVVLLLLLTLLLLLLLRVCIILSCHDNVLRQFIQTKMSHVAKVFFPFQL